MRNFYLLLVAVLFATNSFAYTVTFRVDMTNQVVGPNGVHIAGNFSNIGFPDWDPGAIAMTDANGDHVYEITLNLVEGTVYYFKYINGNIWGQDETVPGFCALGGNRYYTANNFDDFLPVVCFGQCEQCASNPQFRTVIFQVNMQEEVVSPLGVHVAGDFGSVPAPHNIYSDWNPSEILMTDPDGDNIYSASVVLLEDHYYDFKYINGNAWGQDEILSGGCSVNGNRRLYTYAGPPGTVEFFCFGSCNYCFPEHNITFQVNMNNEVVSPNGVHIAGNFGTEGYPDWDPAGIEMLDPDGDGIYTATLALSEYQTFEYKFINGNTWPESENVPFDCASGLNRWFTVYIEDQVIEPVCYDMCLNCPSSLNVVDFTFNVNMQAEVISPNGVHLAGTFGTSGFGEWDPASIEMFDNDGDGIYSVTIPLIDGASYEYKYINGNAWGEDELVPSTCSPNTNRTVLVTGPYYFTEPVCYRWCWMCELIPANDLYENAEHLNPKAYPNCNGETRVVNMSYAHPSPNDQTTLTANFGTGHDVWYEFTATTNAIRCVVESQENDIAIELQDASGNTVFIENSFIGLGDEIMNFAGLVLGQQYYIVVRNVMDGGAGYMYFCLTRLNDSKCNVSNTTMSSLCNPFKVTYTAANAYIVEFKEVPTAGDPVSDVFSYTTNGASTVFPLSNVVGLTYGRQYEVTSEAVYIIENSAGQGATYNVDPIQSCVITITPQAELNLRTTDAAPYQKVSYATVGADKWICGATHYRWALTQTAPSPGLTTYTDGPAGNRFLPLNLVNTQNPGTIVPGGIYTVQVAPVFGSIVGSFGTVDQQLQIIGTAMPLVFDESNEEEKLLIEESSDWAIYPNPSNGEVLNINATELTSAAVQVRVLDAVGKIVFAKNYTTEGTLNTVLSFENGLSTGLYMIELIDGKNIHTKRMVIQN